MSKTGFPAAARRELADTQMRRNVGKATSTIRARRAARVAEVPDWEELRDAGAAIKARAMATLPCPCGSSVRVSAGNRFSRRSWMNSAPT